jgi:succinate-acetate transporter protein
MDLGDSNQRFGIFWLIFGYTLALHVLDEASNDFLSVYNPNAAVIRRAMPFLRVRVFTFQSWIGTLMLALVIWLALSPLVFRGLRWLRVLAVPSALVVGILNGSAHILSSIYLGRWMPGVYSSPLLLLSGTLLLREALGGKGKTLA